MITCMPAARAEAMPSGASSTARQRSGGTSRRRAAATNRSGAGLPCLTSSRVTRAAKWSVRPSASIPGWTRSRLAPDATAQGSPPRRAAHRSGVTLAMGAMVCMAASRWARLARMISSWGSCWPPGRTVSRSWMDKPTWWWYQSWSRSRSRSRPCGASADRRASSWLVVVSARVPSKSRIRASKPWRTTGVQSLTSAGKWPITGRARWFILASCPRAGRNTRSGRLGPATARTGSLDRLRRCGSTPGSARPPRSRWRGGGPRPGSGRDR